MLALRGGVEFDAVSQTPCRASSMFPVMEIEENELKWKRKPEEKKSKKAIRWQVMMIEDMKIFFEDESKRRVNHKWGGLRIIEEDRSPHGENMTPGGLISELRALLDAPSPLRSLSLQGFRNLSDVDKKWSGSKSTTFWCPTILQEQRREYFWKPYERGERT